MNAFRTAAEKASGQNDIGRDEKILNAGLKGIGC